MYLQLVKVATLFAGESHDYSSLEMLIMPHLMPRLHIFFHGCSMQAEEIGTGFIRESGFIEIADANNLVMIFPQVLIPQAARMILT